MRNTVRIELWKATHNPLFYTSILCGISISSLGIYENIQIVNTITGMLKAIDAEAYGISTSCEGCSLFVNWIATTGMSYASSLFYLVWPILASMPYGWSYCRERSTGLTEQIITRSCRCRYYYEKYLAIFLSGGIAVAFPILWNLLGSALFCPYYVPNVTTSIAPIFSQAFLSKLYYSVPWIYAAIWCGVDFLWGGVTACLCLLVGTKVRLTFLVVLSPFLILSAIDVVYTFACSLMDIDILLSPIQLAKAATFIPNPEWVVFSLIFLLLAITLIAGASVVIKHDYI